MLPSTSQIHLQNNLHHPGGDAAANYSRPNWKSSAPQPGDMDDTRAFGFANLIPQDDLVRLLALSATSLDQLAQLGMPAWLLCSRQVIERPIIRQPSISTPFSSSRTWYSPLSICSRAF
jgi:hypothetical protein